MYVYMIIIYDYRVVFDYMKLEYHIVKIMYQFMHNKQLHLGMSFIRNNNCALIYNMYVCHCVLYM